MSVNAWWSHLRADGVIASGNAGIWVTPLSGAPVEVSAVGTMPVWAGQTLVYNRNDGSTAVGASIMPAAYNEYLGSDFGQFVGFASVGNGWLARYAVTTQNTPAKDVTATLLQSIDSACKPQFLGPTLGYLKPFLPGPDLIRQLWVGGQQRATGIITEWAADRAGAFFVYAVANGTYTKRILDTFGNDCTIRTAQDETPLVAFLGPDGLPHMLSQTQTGTLERMIYSSQGYFIPGILDMPDARMIGAQLRVVGSDRGVPRNLWIDFNAPRVDLRTV